MLVSLGDVLKAIEHDELVPCFQPLIELRTGRLAGFEVLMRWEHPQSSLVMPDNFILLAEENGLLGHVMGQILRKAFASVLDLPDSPMLAVNVSPIQLRELSLSAQIRDAAVAANFPLDHLTIEITESALLNDLGRARTIACKLKGMGCRLALDDFGTGYSSPRHLQALPFDELKIDASFVRLMTKTRDNRKIAAAIVGLGHSLGLITVAEGIETEEQAAILLGLSCELGQGWLYGRPVTADGIPAIVARPSHHVSSTLSMEGDRHALPGLEAFPTHRLAQLQAIYDGAPVGLCFLDCNLRYVSLNRRLADMNHAPITAHLGKTVREMIPKLFPVYEQYLLRALRGEAIAGVEVARPASRPGEQDRMCLASYQPAWDDAGEVIGLSISVVDITELKRTKESHRESQYVPSPVCELSSSVT
jgi:EAL domain-containing protein (putative c-di-GMP-specific phosphodiesterase class I)